MNCLCELCKSNQLSFKKFKSLVFWLLEIFKIRRFGCATKSIGIQIHIEHIKNSIRDISSIDMPYLVVYLTIESVATTLSITPCWQTV